MKTFGALSLWLALSGCMDSQRARVAADTIAEVSDTGSADIAVPDGTSDTTVADDIDASAPDTGTVRFFEGGWLIEQPMHALYEASYYRFAADGRIELVVSSPPDCTGHLERFCETGHVSPGGKALLCRFGGGAWSEEPDRILAIDTVCDDGVSRRLRLDFADLDTSTWGTPRILDVDGEEGWTHASWDWTFRRCEAELEFGFEPVRCQ